MKRALFRVLLLSGTLACTVSLLLNFADEWAANQPTIAKLSRRLQWNSGNSSLWTQYAILWMYDSSQTASGKAQDAFVHAIELNPLDPANWEGLTSVYLRRWDSAKAETVLRSWLVAVPRSPEAAWRLGNLLVMQDRTKEAFPYLKAAATGDPALEAPLFDLAWKAIADPEVILRELVPVSAEARADYLQFLIQMRKLSEARQVWPEVRRSGDKRAVSLGYFYVDRMIEARMSDDAAKVWSDLLEHTGRAFAKPAGDLMTNGDFEADLPNAGLDWRLESGPGYRITLDDSAAQSGSHSLLISFDGSSNPDFANVTQMVPVQPSQDYRFSAYIKTENITTDNGPYFSVVSFSDLPAERLERRSEIRLGTNPWTLEQLDFRTGTTTRFVQVILRRVRSGKLNNLIHGKVWIDNVSIVADSRDG